MWTTSEASSWILASAAFLPVLKSTKTYRPCEKVPNRVRGAGVPQMVHFGARTGFVQELQMSHRQTWLILRDMVWGGSPWDHARRRCPGVTLWYVVAACRSNYAALMNCIVAARAAWDSAHRFAAVLPLGAPGTRSNIVGSRPGRDACGRNLRYDSCKRPAPS